MLTALEATIEKDGDVRLKEPVHLTHPCRAIVTIIDELPVSTVSVLSEQSLAEDWNKPEEDEAWSHLHQDV